MRRSLVLGALLASAGCKSETGADPAEVETTSTPTKGSAGGFSASLSAELGSGAKPGAGSAGTPSAGSAATPAAGSAAGSAATPAAGSGAGSAATPAAGSGAGSAATPAAGSGAGSAATIASGSGAKPGAGSAATPAAGSGAGPLAAGSGAKPGAGSAATPAAAGSGAKAGAASPIASGSGAAPAVKPKPVMTPELQAIKLSLKPNWDRDVEEAGSISLFVKGPNALFKFNYGYEDPKAPTDREAYKKFLGDSGALKVLADRQSGAAWYLEGTDASSHAAFRIVVNYGGKRLVCGGSLYKDSGLGDLRDDVLVDAKKICETIQL